MAILFPNFEQLISLKFTSLPYVLLISKKIQSFGYDTLAKVMINLKENRHARNIYNCNTRVRTELWDMEEKT